MRTAQTICREAYDIFHKNYERLRIVERPEGTSSNYQRDTPSLPGSVLSLSEYYDPRRDTMNFNIAHLKQLERCGVCVELSPIRKLILSGVFDDLAPLMTGAPVPWLTLPRPDWQSTWDYLKSSAPSAEISILFGSANATTFCERTQPVLINIDYDFLNMTCKTRRPEAPFWQPHYSGPRDEQLRQYYKVAAQTHRLFQNEVAHDPEAWKGKNFSVVVAGCIDETDEEPFERTWLLPKNLDQVGTVYCTRLPSKPLESIQVRIREMGISVLCNIDGTVAPNYASYEGIQRLFEEEG
ncbi:hypothetical protein N431DRAFT_485978 [Stipitochalara longipes BDJ]|nr:hypothetical protein N431DRAFT_485978 [Stipitochalara longipes BDJ]